MYLNDLLKHIISDKIQVPSVEITGLSTDSRTIETGNLFIAIPGNHLDGHDFIQTALKKGANAVVTNGRDVGNLPVPQIKVGNPQRVASNIAAAYYGHPSRDLTIIGVTGTNGKTTTATLIRSIFTKAETKIAQLGTFGIIADGFETKRTLTTYDPITLHKRFRELLDRGFSTVVMEVSSHALDQHRVADVDFNIGVFTNLTPEHLDYHKTLDQYFHAKAKLFKMLPLTGTAIVNIDDEYGKMLEKNSSAPVLTSSLNQASDIHYNKLTTTIGGIRGEIQVGDNFYKISSSLIGKFNAENILSAVAVANALGINKKYIIEGVLECKIVPGRMEIFETQQGGKVIIDYAHTPDAYEKVLSTVNEIKNDGSEVTLVFGAGGNRDKSKRPMMAQVAEKYADRCFVTPDNPRFEDPNEITQQVIKGFTKNIYTIFTDRGEAVQKGLSELKINDFLVILGKGREEYQDVRGEKIFYSDLKLIEEYL